jgi:hypothetical protein
MGRLAGIEGGGDDGWLGRKGEHGFGVNRNWMGAEIERKKRKEEERRGEEEEDEDWGVEGKFSGE